eukprot:33187-Hanusia_phi.AAC.2
MLVYLLQSLGVVLGQPDLLPPASSHSPSSPLNKLAQVRWRVSTLDGLDVQNTLAVLFVDRRILENREREGGEGGRHLTVCERTRLPVAQASHVVLISTEVLLLVCQPASIGIRARRSEDIETRGKRSAPLSSLLSLAALSESLSV